MPTAPQILLPVGYRRRPFVRRRRTLLGSFGLMPVHPPGPMTRPCPQIQQWIPPGCTVQITYDSSGCPTRTPVCPPAGPATPQQPPAISANGAAGTPVPTGFPTNQFFVAPDGSVWEYSQAQRKWLNTGTPYNVNAPAVYTAAPAIATVPAAAPGAPVSVSVAPTAAPSPYQSILDFATQDTLIPRIPNWLTGLGVFLLVKTVTDKFGSKR